MGLALTQEIFCSHTHPQFDNFEWPYPRIPHMECSIEQSPHYTITLLLENQRRSSILVLRLCVATTITLQILWVIPTFKKHNGSQESKLALLILASSNPRGSMVLLAPTREMGTSPLWVGLKKILAGDFKQEDKNPWWTRQIVMQLSTSRMLQHEGGLPYSYGSQGSKYGNIILGLNFPSFFGLYPIVKFSLGANILLTLLPTWGINGISFQHLSPLLFPLESRIPHFLYL
jgi:hypothetical protein